MRDTTTHWKLGDEDMTEWYEEISGKFFEFIDFYKEEIAKASRDSHDIIDFLNPLMRSWWVIRLYGVCLTLLYCLVY